jgi:thiamine-monophosphate kinase
MKLSSIGEFGLIEEYIAPEFKNLIQKHMTGIGDDCAIIPAGKTTSHLFTTDMLIEKTHFLREKISPFQLGFKSLAVNLSDIAAMGGKPISSFLSVGLPEEIDIEWVKEFMRGYKDLSEKENTPLLGGDTTKSEDKIIINVGVAGEIQNDKIKRRNAAREGDVICVTNTLGDSAGGLQCILNNIRISDKNQKLFDQHLTPYPHVKEGQWLAERKEVHAMIDTSDGLSSDLMHILKASNAKAHIDVEKIPMTKELIETAEKHNWNSLEMAVSGGEDYGLLLTIDKNAFSSIKKAFIREFQKELFPVGEIVTGEAKIQYFKENKPIENIRRGYTHF